MPSCEAMVAGEVLKAPIKPRRSRHKHRMGICSHGNWFSASVNRLNNLKHMWHQCSAHPPFFFPSSIQNIT
ncbi:hypothetical protein TSUD_386440 [Trifolium subterraneum]|uniref:Uncharacterized protein n=1 Tax=Trifolium subterraneum TaxID=3900 RepID=A0A2Z6NPG7_TRISU|nr:hypothetical protein TSUD_386440 [Trifolium subterraneum]